MSTKLILEILGLALIATLTYKGVRYYIVNAKKEELERVKKEYEDLKSVYESVSKTEFNDVIYFSDAENKTKEEIYKEIKGV